MHSYPYVFLRQTILSSSRIVIERGAGENEFSTCESRTCLLSACERSSLGCAAIISLWCYLGEIRASRPGEDSSTALKLSSTPVSDIVVFFFISVSMFLCVG